MSKLYLEDLAPGQVYGSPRYEMTAESIKDFARQWDPQFFHLDEDAAKESFFDGLAASGWHTAAATMRMLVSGEFQPANGCVGAGFEGLRWHRPVRPGDVLTVRTEVLEVRPLRSKPGYGMVKVRVTTLDAEARPVQEFIPSMVVVARG